VLTKDVTIFKDANVNVLENGDSVVVIKDLPVKGATRSIKDGAEVKNNRVTKGDHNFDCKINRFGAIIEFSTYCFSKT